MNIAFRIASLVMKSDLFLALFLSHLSHVWKTGVPEEGSVVWWIDNNYH